MARPSKKHNRIKNRIVAASIFAIATFTALGFYLSRYEVPVLQPAGPIAAGQKELLIWASLLMLIVVLPVFVLAFSIAWRYRESNKMAVYKPNWDRNGWLEAIWWLIPSALIVVLAVITWHGTYKYDPHKPIASATDSLVVQVVALDWRWLFIYPEQKVASINELRLPVDTPIQFEITADAPMNSFWIPQLGGQIYAMPGMGTQLHLLADRTGTFYGSSANISGEGFAKMKFQTIATSKQDFDVWTVGASKQKPLTQAAYAQVAKQTKDQRVYTYSEPAKDLYSTIISKYMKMQHQAPAQAAPEHMSPDHTHMEHN